LPTGWACSRRLLQAPRGSTELAEVRRPAGSARDDPAVDPPSEKRPAENLTFIEGAAIGATQTFALLPGISRSGVTIASGLLAGLSYEQASRFSFMLATYVIAWRRR